MYIGEGNYIETGIEKEQGNFIEKEKEVDKNKQGN